MQNRIPSIQISLIRAQALKVSSYSWTVLGPFALNLLVILWLIARDRLLGLPPPP